VDIANATDDPAVATQVAEHLVDVGLVVGTVTTTADPASTSAIQYADSQLADAQTLADALVQAPLLTVADVPEITLVLGATDPSGLLASLQKFTGLPCTG
jgi:LytR cell envelope-related transcriptional attenuator